MREPWFRILEVWEDRGRSIADIAAEVAARCKVSLREMRGPHLHAYLQAARTEAIRQIKAERPDLTSRQVAAYFNRDGSSIRRCWRSPDITADLRFEARLTRYHSMRPAVTQEELL